MWVVEFSLYFWGQVSFKERADEKGKQFRETLVNVERQKENLKVSIVIM